MNFEEHTDPHNNHERYASHLKVANVCNNSVQTPQLMSGWLLLGQHACKTAHSSLLTAPLLACCCCCCCSLLAALCRPAAEGAGWMYSAGLVDLVQQYKGRFPNIIQVRYQCFDSKCSQSDGRNVVMLVDLVLQYRLAFSTSSR
jgi:hypothetical protein